MVSRSFERILWPALTAVLALVVWHFAVRWTKTSVFPPPLAVAAGFAELARRGVLFRYAADSLFRVASGYGLALALGIPTGLLLGWSPTGARAANPVIQLLRPISPLAWIPVSIVLFGISNFATIFLIFLASFFPIVVATMNGVRAIPVMYLLAGQNFDLSPAERLWRVMLPAALPQVLTGLRIALGIAWLVVVAAEMIAVDSGLGYLVIDSRNAGKRYDLVVAAMILIGVIGVGLNVLMRRVERLRSVRWGFRAA
ncbi:MAG: ABC transporter permease [Thermoanaerobaculia bacterium]